MRIVNVAKLIKQMAKVVIIVVLTRTGVMVAANQRLLGQSVTCLNRPAPAKPSDFNVVKGDFFATTTPHPLVSVGTHY